MVDSSDLAYDDETELEELGLSDDTIDDDTTKSEIPDRSLAEHIMQKVASPRVPEERAPTRLDRKKSVPFTPEDSLDAEDTADISDTLAPPPGAELPVPATIPLEEPKPPSRTWIVFLLGAVVAAAATASWAVFSGAVPL